MQVYFVSFMLDVYASILLHHDLLEQSARMQALPQGNQTSESHKLVLVFVRPFKLFHKKRGSKNDKTCLKQLYNYCLNKFSNESPILHHLEKYMLQFAI